MIIRQERKEDYFEVETLLRKAFWNVYRPGCFEHLVIHNTRNSPDFVKELDYVIEDDGKIVASIVYALGTCTLKNQETKKVLLFGPIGVLPSYQHKGYGKTIITYTMNEAKELGYNAIFITGNPKYYHRFGFESASKYEIYYQGLDPVTLGHYEESSFFMIAVLDKEKFDIKEAIYQEPTCYNVDENELLEFDKQFQN